MKQLELIFDKLKTEKASKEEEFEKLTEIVENGHEEINRILMDMSKTIQHNKRQVDDEIALKVNRVCAIVERKINFIKICCLDVFQQVRGRECDLQDQRKRGRIETGVRQAEAAFGASH